MNEKDYKIKAVAVAGLGLIGGSMAKAVKSKTGYFVKGCDTDVKTAKAALSAGAVDAISENDFSDVNLILLAVYPQAAVEFIKNNLDNFIDGTVIIDLCGVKGRICAQAKKILAGRDVLFIGGHPMAGIEKSGFENSSAELFKNASMILTPENSLNENLILELKQFFFAVGFNRIEYSDAETHDRIIAYTSQLAHVVSSAYMKSPSAEKNEGFSAGSFKDLTRVAKLNPAMWTELFISNKDCLLPEIENIIQNLTLYKNAINEENKQELFKLLKESSDIKERLDNRNNC